MSLNSLFDHLPAGGTLADAKDRLISARIKQELNGQLTKYGEILDVKLNTREQSVEISVRLKGEADPIRIRLGKYSLVKENGELWLTIDAQTIEASKEWLTLLLQDHAGRHRLPIPHKFAGLVEFLS
jgi:hypothetical protein